MALGETFAAGLTVELSGAAAAAWAWHFIPHASAPMMLGGNDSDDLHI